MESITIRELKSLSSKCGSSLEALVALGESVISVEEDGVDIAVNDIIINPEDMRTMIIALFTENRLLTDALKRRCPTHLQRVLCGERKPGANLECRMLKYRLIPLCSADDVAAAGAGAGDVAAAAARGQRSEVETGKESKL